MAEPGVMMLPAVLLAMAEGFAGQRLVVDARLRLPACGAPVMAWADMRGVEGVEVRCAQPAWRVLLPVVADGVRTDPQMGVGQVRMVDEAAGQGADGARALPRFRKGERVTLRMRGRGFLVSLEGVVQGAAPAGRLWVKAAGGDGRRRRARVAADGGLEIGGAGD